MGIDMKKFLVMQQHLDLLRHAHIKWQDEINGHPSAPGIHPERPYGDENWIASIAKIIGEPIDEHEDDDQKDKRWRRYTSLHESTDTALQICLCTQQFKAGLYQQENEDDPLSWKWLCEVEEASQHTYRGTWGFSPSVN